ncbi:MAG: asparagine synthase-related protein, partial [Planctomycetota bacterium]
QPDSKLRPSLFAQLYPYVPGLQSQSLSFRRAFFHASAEDLANPLFSHLPRWGMSSHMKRFLLADYAWEEGCQIEHGELLRWLPPRFKQWRPFCQAQFLETAILLPGYILSTQGDRMAMSRAVEGRFPFLDHHVAELAAGMPPRLKMKGIQEKYLLKRAFRDIVPCKISRRAKQPYRAPDAKSFFTPNWQSARDDYVNELLSAGNLRDAGVFEPRMVMNLLRKVQSGKLTGTRDNMTFVAILSTQLLVDQFIRDFPRNRTPAQKTHGTALNV